MLHQNAIAERRLFQLYIPGLTSKQANGRFGDSGLAKAEIVYENDWRFSKANGLRGPGQSGEEVRDKRLKC